MAAEEQEVGGVGRGSVGHAMELRPERARPESGKVWSHVEEAEYYSRGSGSQ